MQLAADIASGQAERNNEYALSQIGARGNISRDLANIQSSGTLAGIRLKGDIANEATNRQYQFIYKMARDAYPNASEDEIAALTARIILGGNSKTAKGSIEKDREPTKTEQKIINAVRKAEQAIANKDVSREEDGDAHANALAIVRKAFDDGEIDSDQLAKYEEMLSKLSDIRQNKHGF